MKKFLDNDKVYYIITIIMIIILIAIILTGGIQAEIKISDERIVDNGGPSAPSDTGSVTHSTTSLLILNIAILIISIVFSIYCYARDNHNNLKLKIVAVFLVLAFLAPIFVEEKYENQITIGGEQENLRTDYGKTNFSIVDKILQKETINNETSSNI